MKYFIQVFRPSEADINVGRWENTACRSDDLAKIMCLAENVADTCRMNISKVRVLEVIDTIDCTADLFQPDWVSPPGDTINAIMQERDLSCEYLAAKLGKSTEFVTRLLTGDEPIDKKLAELLSATLGSTPKFWLKREQTYRKDKARLGK